MFYYRYPGPLLAGMGLFFNIMVILYLLWQTDIKLKQTYVRKSGLDVYERGIIKWKREHKELWKSQSSSTPDQRNDINKCTNTQNTPIDGHKKRDQKCTKVCKESCKNCKEDKSGRTSSNIKETFVIDDNNRNISSSKANFEFLAASAARRKLKSSDIDLEDDLTAEATC